MPRSSLSLAFLSLSVLAASFASALLAAEHSFEATVEAGKIERLNTPVRLAIELPTAFEKASSVTVTDAQGGKLAGQITRPSLLAEAKKPGEGKFAAELNFILPKLAAGEAAKFKVAVSDAPAGGSANFNWADTSKPKGADQPFHEQSRELRLGERPVLRYMFSTLDESTGDIRMSTYKPYHHVYDVKGTRFVTKGPGGVFPHHRGLYFGFNRISYDDGKKQADTWHCNKGEHQSHEAFESEEAGPVLGRHVVKIDWHGRDKQVFAVEHRELTAYNTPAGTLIEFATLLESKVGPIRLDGDPQHAGFQFRASQDVPDKTKDKTYYLRPDGKGEPGKFRNWPGDKQHVDLPWNALSFMLGEQRYTCCYLDRPENPKEARFSERDYGRFGSYFEYDMTAEKPLKLNYRVWLQEGEMTVPQVQRLDDDFTQAPTAKAAG